MSGVRAGGSPPTTQDEAIKQLRKVAANSQIAHYNWLDRGVAPPGYIQGMVVCFARNYCRLQNGDPYATEMAKAKTANTGKDALAHYAQRFQQLGMSNAAPGKDTLRHVFVLLIGLGMRESSGRYCEGRDLSASNITAETAEAGAFQTSFDSRKASPLLPKLIARYNTAAPPPSLLEIFKLGVTAKPKDLQNFGTGPGRDFQKRSKESPAFAAEYAAVCLRNIRTHYGPINTRKAEVKPDCDALLKKVQDLADSEQLGPLLGE